MEFDKINKRVLIEIMGKVLREQSTRETRYYHMKFQIQTKY